MTIPVSTVPAAETYITSAISTAIAGDSLSTSILVCTGEPGMDLPNDVIAVGYPETRRAVDPRFFVGSGGSGWLYETYEVDITISTWQGGGSSQSATVSARAWTLASYVETAVRTDPSLGGAVIVSYPMDTVGGDPQWTEEPIGLGATITMTVHCEARI